MRKRETSVSTISVNKISSRPVYNLPVIIKERHILPTPKLLEYDIELIRDFGNYSSSAL